MLTTISSYTPTTSALGLSGIPPKDIFEGDEYMRELWNSMSPEEREAQFIYTFDDEESSSNESISTNSEDEWEDCFEGDVEDDQEDHYEVVPKDNHDQEEREIKVLDLLKSCKKTEDFNEIGIGNEDVLRLRNGNNTQDIIKKTASFVLNPLGGLMESLVPTKSGGEKDQMKATSQPESQPVPQPQAQPQSHVSIEKEQSQSHPTPKKSQPQAQSHASPEKQQSQSSSPSSSPNSTPPLSPGNSTTSSCLLQTPKTPKERPLPLADSTFYNTPYMEEQIPEIIDYLAEDWSLNDELKRKIQNAIEDREDPRELALFDDGNGLRRGIKLVLDGDHRTYETWREV